jgi:hypothetical protein
MYWKASYQKAESERLRLLNELDQMKHERDSLRSHTDPQDRKGSSAPGKRKQDTPAQRPGKKTKNHLDLDLDEVDVDFDLANTNTPCIGMSLDLLARSS